MSRPPIGVAIAGLGFGEKVHLEALSAHPGLQPVALWHPRQERLQKAVQKHSLTGYTSWDELLNDPQIDAIVIATPPEPRFELARRALEAGKHLLLEKPVALQAHEVSELQRIALRQQLSVAVDFEYRAVPLFMQAARLLEGGAVGTPWLVKLDWLMSSRADASRPWNWYSQRECGGGVLGALGTHAFDMLAWLIGPINSIQAVNHVSIKERPHPDGTMATVDAEDVSLIQTTLNWQGQCDHLIPAQVSLSSVARNGRGCWIEVYGSDGTLRLGSSNQKDYVHGFGLWYGCGNETLRAVSPDPDLVFHSTWSDGRIAPVARIQDWWAESIRSGTPMVPGLAEGLASQMACDQSINSSAH